jgi:hypothetical protein
MKLKLDNGITLEVEGNIEVSVSQDGKTISIKPTGDVQEPAPVITAPLFPPQPWQPYAAPFIPYVPPIIPNTAPWNPCTPGYPWTSPNTTGPFISEPNITITCGDPHTQTVIGGEPIGNGICGNSYTVRPGDGTQVFYTGDAQTQSLAIN